MNTLHSIKYFSIIFIVALTISGCAAGRPMVAVTPEAPMDNPKHLCLNGHRALAEGKLDEAVTLFEKALAKDPLHLPSMLGMAKAHTAMGDRKAAFKWSRMALKQSKGTADRLAAQTTLLKTHLAFKPDDWFKHMEALWKEIRKAHEKPEEAALVMGKGYQAAGQDLPASVCFKQVLAWKGDFTAEADRLLETLYAQLRAEPGTDVGRTVSKMDKVSRGDVAALLIEELKLPEYFEALKTKTYHAEFKTPSDTSKQRETISVSADVAGHPYERDILAVLEYAVRGLELFPDGLFHPDAPLSRANFALVVEDILVRIKKEPLLKTEFIGNTSPFPDVPKDHYALNAMYVCTTRNFLAADLDGAFRPEAPATGAECLLAVRRLKEEIKNRQIKY